MEEKITGDLSRELMSQPDLDAYIRENQEIFVQRDFDRLLLRLYKSRHLSKVELARRSGISEVYLHQVFARRRNPSRDRLICICVGLNASLEETQALLKYAGCAQLYPRRKRDAIVIYGLIHGMELADINDKLFTEDEKTLF